MLLQMYRGRSCSVLNQTEVLPGLTSTLLSWHTVESSTSIWIHPVLMNLLTPDLLLFAGAH